MQGEFYYVYILHSVAEPDRYYTGCTADVGARLKKHNEGGVPSTAEHRPWKIKTVVAFSDAQRARDFEHYLKSPSGRAFAKKRL